MNRDDLRLDIKWVMCENLIKIIEIRDQCKVPTSDLTLGIDYDIYSKLIETLNDGEFDSEDMKYILKMLTDDNEYLNTTYNKLIKIMDDMEEIINGRII